MLLKTQTFQSVFHRQSPRPDTKFSLGAIFLAMGSWKRPDPELLPIHRPRCPKCQKRMISTAVSDGPDGFERRRFDCLKCTVTEMRTLASDPLKSDALRWLSGELGRTDKGRLG
jgi:hypothetical protein